MLATILKSGPLPGGLAEEPLRFFVIPPPTSELFLDREVEEPLNIVGLAEVVISLNVVYRERRSGIKDVIDSEGDGRICHQVAPAPSRSFRSRSDGFLTQDFISFFVIPWLRSLRCDFGRRPELIRDLPV